MPDARRVVEAELEAIDRACSRFRPDSELSRVNAAEGRWVEISPLFMAALEAALWAARATGGSVDATVGGLLKVIGYDRDFSALVASDDPITVRAARVPGWTAIELDVVGRSVRLARGAELDLGSTAKALAADRAASLAARVGQGVAPGSGVLVSLGGDIAVGGLAPAGGWPVAVAEDHREPTHGDSEVIVITSGGLATSSTKVRRWTRAGVEYHHIIDPATGLPADGPWRTATIAAATCLEANAAATAAIVMGVSAPEWLQKSGLPARLVRTDGRILRLPGWPRSSG
jgi:thiamine biosynthesis lipoprotein